MRDSEAPRYNRVYENLVQSNDDLVGLVAYSLYKQHKRDWLISFEETHGSRPSNAELEAFLLGVLVPEQIAKYRQAAAEALVDYAQASVAAEEPRIREEAISQRVSGLAVSVERAAAWYRQVPAGIASALVYTLVLIAFLLVLRYAGVDLASIIDQIERPAGSGR